MSKLTLGLAVQDGELGLSKGAQRLQQVRRIGFEDDG